MLERILDKLDSIEGKLDGHLERIAKLEERQDAHDGKIKLMLSFVIAGASAAVTAAVQWVRGLIGH